MLNAYSVFLMLELYPRKMLLAHCRNRPEGRELYLQMMLLIKYMNLLMDIRIFYKNGDIRLGNRRKLKILHWM